MPGRAKSMTKKAQIAREEADQVMARAVKLYRSEQEKPEGPRLGLRKVCEEIERQYRLETGRIIHLPHTTLRNLANGGTSMSDFNAKKGWLKPAESEQVIEYCIEVAARGFPLTHRLLKECVDEICRARLGDEFPEGGVGKKWTDRFVEKHSDHIGAFYTHSLEGSRARAVNSHTNVAWFTLLGDVLLTGDDGSPIAQDCVWGVDECGFQPEIGSAQQKAIGGKGTKVHYQQKNGGRENTTVIVLICADGTTIPPSVIMKAKAYNVKWIDDNPAHASIGYSVKGWTDGEIGRLWMENFEKATREKAGGRTRLLLVDGHNSHFTKAFLDYARTHKIHVLCYPSHATHVYQGLDVAVFSVLKRFWAEERDKWQREKGEKITKETFLAIYGRAHIRALTPELIAAAFRKTGVWPYNPSVVTSNMMAPSKETAQRVIFPVIPPTPVRVMTQMMYQVGEKKKRVSVTSEGSPSTSPTLEDSENDSRDTNSSKEADPDSVEDLDSPLELLGSVDNSLDESELPLQGVGLTPVRRGVKHLKKTSARFLVTKTPIKSRFILPIAPNAIISPLSKGGTRYPDLMNTVPKTRQERLFQRALRASEAREAIVKERNVALQASMVLMQQYCDRIKGQLETFEKKQGKGKGKRLHADGMPRLLTEDDFFEKVCADEERQEQMAADKETRRLGREDHQKAIKVWEKREGERKARNEATRVAWKKRVAEWEVEKILAKHEGRKFTGGKKPTLASMGGAEKKEPRPKAVAAEEEDDDDESEASNDEEDNS